MTHRSARCRKAARHCLQDRVPRAGSAVASQILGEARPPGPGIPRNVHCHRPLTKCSLLMTRLRQPTPRPASQTCAIIRHYLCSTVRACRAEVRVIRQIKWVILGIAIAVATLWPSQAAAQRRVIRRPVVRSHVYAWRAPTTIPITTHLSMQDGTAATVGTRTDGTGSITPIRTIGPATTTPGRRDCRSRRGKPRSTSTGISPGLWTILTAGFRDSTSSLASTNCSSISPATAPFARRCCSGLARR